MGCARSSGRRWGCGSIWRDLPAGLFDEPRAGLLAAGLPAGFFAVGFLAAGRFLAVALFLAGRFLAVDFFLAGRFLAVDFRFAVDFLAVDFRAVDFLAVDFRFAVDFFFAVFLAGALFLAAFLAPEDAFFAGLTLPPFVNAMFYGWLLPSKAPSSLTTPFLAGAALLATVPPLLFSALVIGGAR